MGACGPCTGPSTGRGVLGPVGGLAALMGLNESSADVGGFTNSPLGGPFTPGTFGTAPGRRGPPAGGRPFGMSGRSRTPPGPLTPGPLGIGVGSGPPVFVPGAPGMPGTFATGSGMDGGVQAAALVVPGA